MASGEHPERWGRGSPSVRACSRNKPQRITQSTTLLASHEGRDPDSELDLHRIPPVSKCPWERGELALQKRPGFALKLSRFRLSSYFPTEERAGLPYVKPQWVVKCTMLIINLLFMRSVRFEFTQNYRHLRKTLWDYMWLFCNLGVQFSSMNQEGSISERWTSLH